MEKYKKMRNDQDLWSVAMAIEMGEFRRKNQLAYFRENGIAEGLAKGKAEGKAEAYFNLAEMLVKQKFGCEERSWLKTLTIEQLEKIAMILNACNSLEDLKKQICEEK